MSYSLYLLTLYPLDNNAYVTILSPRCGEILKISWIIPSSWAYLLSPYADVLLLKSLRLLRRVTTETQLRRSANCFHLKPNLRMVLTCFFINYFSWTSRVFNTVVCGVFSKRLSSPCKYSSHCSTNSTVPGIILWKFVCILLTWCLVLTSKF